MKLLSFCFLLILALPFQGFCNTYTVHNNAEFTQLSSKLLPGDNVSIADGVYADWHITLRSKGTADAPITIQPQNAGMVTFSGNATEPIFELKGAYLVLSGFNFTKCNLLKTGPAEGTLVAIRSADNCKVQNCSFSRNVAQAQFLPMVQIAGNGDSNTITNCSFTSNVNEIDVQIKVTKQAYPTNTIISNNIFKYKERVTWMPSNGGECVQVGQDNVNLGESEPKAIVRNNTFIKCNGDDEVISNKSSANQYLSNKFVNCQGELVMRGGSDCIIDGNVIDGGKGIRVCGTGHTVTNNIISHTATGIRLMYGMSKGRLKSGFYVAASGCVIKNNKFNDVDVAILVGDGKNKNWRGKFDLARYPSRTMQDVAPSDNQIQNNSFLRSRASIINQ